MVLLIEEIKLISQFAYDIYQISYNQDENYLFCELFNFNSISFLQSMIITSLYMTNLNSNQVMSLQPNKKIVKVIETTKGEIYSPHSNSDSRVQLTIFNEIFTPQPAKAKSNCHLDLEHVNFHKTNLYSLENTSIAWASIEHEIRQILSKTNINEEDLLIFESSTYNSKIPQIFSRYKIVKGFNYRINLQSFENISQDKIALMKGEHVLKQIQMEFGLGNGTFKPGYIGQISFEEVSTPIFQGIINAYINYSSKTQCPIVIDFASQGEETYQLLFEQDAKLVIENFERKLKTLQELLNKSKEKNCSQNLIIYNLPIILIYQKATSKIINHFQKYIEGLVTQYNITLGFKLLRYSKFNQKQAIDQIIKLVQKYTNNIILSSGIKYKTDFTSNSGQGLSLYNFKAPLQNKNISHMNSIEYIRHFVPEEILDQVLRLNILRIFDWKEKKQEVKIEVFWKCDTCTNDFSESLKAFGKFGKQFCSIKCLKTYKF